MKIIGIIKKSEWKRGEGVDPHCIVMLQIEKGGHLEYTTHEMVMRPGKKEPEFYLGHYFMSLGAASTDFKKRAK